MLRRWMIGIVFVLAVAAPVAARDGFIGEFQGEFVSRVSANGPGYGSSG